MSFSKYQNEGLLRWVVKEYARLLREKPVVTKASTSAVTGALGSLVSQLMTSSAKGGQHINWRSVGAYALVGFIFIGPSVHHFHAWLERTFASGSSQNVALKKLLLDRILFCPSFLLVYLYLLNIFEGHRQDIAIRKLRESYWPALQINLKVWTPLQYLNVKYIPHQYRAPFMSFLALLWTIYIASKRR